MHHGHHVGPHPIDLPMDEALAVKPCPLVIEPVAVEIVGDDVLGGDQARSAMPRHQELGRVLVVADADMAERVHHLLMEQDAVADDEVLDKGGRGGGYVAHRRLRTEGGMDSLHRNRENGPGLRAFPCTAMMFAHGRSEPQKAC